MSGNLATVSYIGATILFILSLGGLSNPETSRRGNLYGMIGMTIAVLATVFGPRVTAAGYPWIIGAMVAGGAIGLYAAKVVKMTQMPELVALMHSLVGLAACLVGFASYIDTSAPLTGAEKTIHELEIYIGILIGAVTFSGSVIAFGKLSGKISGKPLLLPARHWLNLAGLVVVIWLGSRFIAAHSVDAGMLPLVLMTAIALLFGKRLALLRQFDRVAQQVLRCFIILLRIGVIGFALGHSLGAIGFGQIGHGMDAILDIAAHRIGPFVAHHRYRKSVIVARLYRCHLFKERIREGVIIVKIALTFEVRVFGWLLGADDGKLRIPFSL